jgi:glycerol-3-phosphate dehydrogenase
LSLLLPTWEEKLFAANMMSDFSALKRALILDQAREEHFDLIVIGGGITGAGIALDAAVRGIKTLLVEMQDFAAGTSSRSTKLVHGGLRYLKQLEFGLVAEVGKERAIVFENGPHVTKAEHMLLPLVKGGSIGSIGAFAGMYLYDFLAGVKKHEHRKILNKEETLSKEPLLKEDILNGGVFYYEYRTDDARLTLEVLKEAINRGAIALNYVKASEFIYDEKKMIRGIKARDLIGGNEYTFSSSQVVNATGPWVDMIDVMDRTDQGNKLHLTKGVHIVVDHKKLPIRQSIYFDTDDSRMIFAIPREGKTYIGTTDTSYTGNLENPTLNTDDKSYLVKAVNRIFPAVNLTIQDIESGWAGLRPLIRQRGKSSPSAISRKDEIFKYPSGLLTIAGGKLTGYRKMAERITDLVASRIKVSKRSFPACTTDKIKISGGKVGGGEKFSQYIRDNIKTGINAGLSEEAARAILEKYGSNADKLFDIIKTRSEEAKKFKLPLTLYAQVVYAIEHEMCMNPSDFFIRRTSDLYFNIDWVKNWKNEVIIFMSVYLGWTEQVKNSYKDALEKSIEEVSKI